jgi:signal transduction histidine kinase
VAFSLRAVPLFAELADEDLARVEASSAVLNLEAGEQLFAEGDEGVRAFVIGSGEIEILKRTGDREVLLAVRKPGEVIGEMALVHDAPRSATARARTDAEVLCIPKAEIDALMETSIGAVRALFRVLLDRWQQTQALLAQSERMAQLGTLTAGLAHELNNPAAAVSRAVGQLRPAVVELVRTEVDLSRSLAPDRIVAVEALRERMAARGDQIIPPDAITRSDLEADVEDRLMDAGVENAWRLAPMIVETDLVDLLDDFLVAGGGDTGAVLGVLSADHEVSSLLHEVEEGTRRMSAIVRALKSYSYLDQAPVQDVDLIAGLEDTLLILKSKLEGIEVRREYGDDLPHIEAHGAQLNQVWTNLIDNAADAIRESGRTDGRVTIRARAEGDSVAVEIEDNGKGIPPEAKPRLFDSFFTTKPPGKGTGLGLNISYGIVVHEHRGDVTVESEPGRTVFRVELPRRAAAS